MHITEQILVMFDCFRSLDQATLASIQSLMKPILQKNACYIDTHSPESLNAEVIDVLFLVDDTVVMNVTFSYSFLKLSHRYAASCGDLSVPSVAILQETLRHQLVH